MKNLFILVVLIGLVVLISGIKFTANLSDIVEGRIEQVIEPVNE